jgi:hypothetical protein
MKLRNYFIVLMSSLLIACATTKEVAQESTQRKSQTTERTKDLNSLIQESEKYGSVVERNRSLIAYELASKDALLDAKLEASIRKQTLLEANQKDLEEKFVKLDDFMVEHVRNTTHSGNTGGYITYPVALYPPSETGAYPDTRPYVAPTVYPSLLVPFNVATNNLQVTRISDKNMASNPTGFQMRHDYSKDQVWNADGTEIQLAASGGQAQVLDGETYQFLRYATNVPSRNRWSYVNPDLMYGVSGNRLVSVSATTGTITTIHTFTGYAEIELGLGEGNQSNDDRYWAIIGKNNGWTNSEFIVYDLQTDTVVGTKVEGDLGGIIDWVSMSQGGEYFVVRYNPFGSGVKQGIKRWNRDFSEELHIWDNPQHGDIGVGVNGNPVWVTIGSGVGFYLHMTDMVTGVTTGLVWQEAYGIEGAHVSCRNINRPGWAYVSVEPPLSDVNRHRMTREMFAVKLDNSGTFERWGFHNASSRVYWQQPHLTVNQDGTKVMFASSWGDATIDADPYAPSFVTEVDNN